MIVQIDEWNKQRAKIHHGWLLNRYVTFLKANVDFINTPPEDTLNNELIFEQLSSWQLRKSVIVELIENAETALSPLQLLNEPPLDSLPESDKKWLAAVIHGYFLKHSNIPNQIEMLKITFMDVDDLVTLAEDNLKDISTVSADNYGNQLLQKVLELSAQISDLPHTIQIPFGV